MNFDSDMFSSGLGGFLGGLFGDSGKPYEEYQKWGQQGVDAQKPFYNAGVGAVGNYQDWLNTQKDPSGFINSLMKNYNQSPYNTFLQKQAQNAGTNAASASGLIGSTPFLQQSQQNAANIGQQGMQDWLSQVLGINTQYGQGQQNLIQGGQNSANSLGTLYNQMGEAGYGKEAGKHQDFWNTIGGGLGMFGGLGFL